VIGDDERVGKDGVETDPGAKVEREIDEVTDPGAKVEREIDEVTVYERDDVVVVDGEEKVGVEMDGPASLEKMGCMVKVVVIEVALEGGERDALTTGRTELGVIVGVVVGASCAHDGLMYVVLVVRVVCAQVVWDVGDVEGREIGVRIGVEQRIEVWDVVVGKGIVIGVGVMVSGSGSKVERGRIGREEEGVRTGCQVLGQKGCPSVCRDGDGRGGGGGGAWDRGGADEEGREMLEEGTDGRGQWRRRTELYHIIFISYDI